MDTCWCVLNLGIVDELLGVAGMIIVSQWIIPENSLRLAPVRWWLTINTWAIKNTLVNWLL